MKKSILKASLFMMITASALMSCSNDDDQTQPSDSRTVKYEITGNATGTFDVTYISASGAGANEAPTSIPWSKEVIIQNGVAGIIINSAVIGAVPGKTITTKIYVGGVEKKSESATVQSNGRAVIAGLRYTFK